MGCDSCEEQGKKLVHIQYQPLTNPDGGGMDLCEDCLRLALAFLTKRAADSPKAGVRAAKNRIPKPQFSIPEYSG